MAWIIYALGAITATAFSDLFRKLSSNLNDPFFSNLIFQLGSVTMAIILYLLFSRNFENNTKGIIYSIIGGMLISIFATFFFKALSSGPGVSIVVPVVRIGGVILVAILGVLLFKDKLSWQLIVGLLLSISGVYLLFTSP